MKTHEIQNRADFELGKQVGAINSWCEAAAAGAKPMSLSSTFDPGLYSTLLPYMEEAAKTHGTGFYLEEELYPTDLFKTVDMTGQWVFIIYKEQHVIQEYLALKQKMRDAKEHNIYTPGVRLQCAYTFGRLLGYSESILQQRLGKV